VLGVIAVVGATIQVQRWPAGVLVVTAPRLPHALSSMTPRLDPAAIEALFEIARRSTTWTRSIE